MATNWSLDQVSVEVSWDLKKIGEEVGALCDQLEEACEEDFGGDCNNIDDVDGAVVCAFEDMDAAVRFAAHCEALLQGLPHQAPEQMDEPGPGESLWSVTITRSCRSALSFTF